MPSEFVQFIFGRNERRGHNDDMKLVRRVRNETGRELVGERSRTRARRVDQMERAVLHLSELLQTRLEQRWPVELLLVVLRLYHSLRGRC